MLEKEAGGAIQHFVWITGKNGQLQTPAEEPQEDTVISYRPPNGKIHMWHLLKETDHLCHSGNEKGKHHYPELLLRFKWTFVQNKPSQLPSFSP